MSDEEKEIYLLLQGWQCVKFHWLDESIWFHDKLHMTIDYLTIDGAYNYATNR